MLRTGSANSLQEEEAWPGLEQMEQGDAEAEAEADIFLVIGAKGLEGAILRARALLIFKHRVRQSIFKA